LSPRCDDRNTKLRAVRLGENKLTLAQATGEEGERRRLRRRPAQRMTARGRQMLNKARRFRQAPCARGWNVWIEHHIEAAPDLDLKAPAIVRRRDWRRRGRGGCGARAAALRRGRARRQSKQQRRQRARHQRAAIVTRNVSFAGSLASQGRRCSITNSPSPGPVAANISTSQCEPPVKPGWLCASLVLPLASPARVRKAGIC